MALAKRGLGRGLEALLVKVPVRAELSPSPIEQRQEGQDILMPATDCQPLQVLSDNTQQDGRSLLNEAEALKRFLDEFEAIVQRHDI